LLLALAFNAASAHAATITLDDSPAAQRQVIDGFGTCIGNSTAALDWVPNLYFHDSGFSILRMDLTPVFKSPWSDASYNSPWFSNPPPLKIDDPASPGGPERNWVRTYTNASDYGRSFGGRKAPIAVMGGDMAKNIEFFDYDKVAAIGRMAQTGAAQQATPGDFKLYGSIWSPAPWVKVADGRKWGDHQGVMPATGTPYPFIWAGNFAGGKVDTSGVALPVFDDGTGPTSALTQFARCTAAYVAGFQQKFGVKFYALSIQNELNFPEFYNSCVYASAPEYVAALKAVRREFDVHPELKDIILAGPEDLLGDDPYAMWQYGDNATGISKNLQYLSAVEKDPDARAALGLACIHGYARDGATAAGADSPSWQRWVNGWRESPAPGIPADVGGFAAFKLRSWMTETSGETPTWLDPATGFPGNGAWSIALKMQQALTAGRESACIYWQLGEGHATTVESLTQADHAALQPKLVAMRHFSCYIRPGSIALAAHLADDHGITASAYLHAATQTLVTVLVSKNDSTQPADVVLPKSFIQCKTLHLVISSNAAFWQESDIVPEAGVVHLTLPAYSVATLSATQ
jgi:O-glycosyl hydrolase